MKMLTRLCTKEDALQALALVKEFYEEAINDFGVYFNQDIAMQTATQFIDTTFILEDNNKIVGLLSGTIVHLPLSNEKVYHEAIWFVKKAYRVGGIKLYKALEKYCKEQGINKIIMVSMSNSKEDKLGKFYHRLGFELLEKHYIKNVGG